MAPHMLFGLAVMSCLCHVTSAGGSQWGATGSTGDFKFDCRQHGNDCNHDENPCNPSTGVCECLVSPNYEWGFDCKEPSDNSITTDLTTCTYCDKEGTILCVPGGSGSCYCKETHYDTTCNKLRVSHTCTATTMSLSIQPFQSSFEGLVYLRNKKGSCSFTLTPPGPVELTFAHAECGSTAVTVPVPAQKYEIIVQYNPEMKTDKDNLITATCPDGTSQSEVLTPIVSTVSDTDIDDNLRPVSSDLPTGLIATLTEDHTTGTPLTGMVELGDPIYLAITLAKATYNFMKLIELTVSDGASPTPVSKTLVSEGCLTSEARQVVMDFGNTPTSGPDGLLYLYFGAFKIGTTTNAIFTATVIVCQADADECVRTACTELLKTPTERVNYQLGDASTDASNRKRRAAGDQAIFGTMSVEMRINDEVSAFKDMNGQTGAPLSCVQNLVFLLPLIIMAVMLLISMGMTLYFCLKVTQRGGRSPDGNVNMAYKA